MLLKATFEHTDENGFEKKSCSYTKEGFTRNEVERNIFANPFKRFKDMRFMKRCREIEYVEFNRYVFKKLIREEIAWILGYCEEKSGEYYGELRPESL